MSPKPRVIYWFRTDLRLHDSPALHAALDLKPEAFFPIWTWDPHYVYRARVGPNRWQVLLDCQSDLSTSLTNLNKSQKLHVIREAPQTLFPKLFKTWSITHLVFEKDTDAYARSRDAHVTQLAKDAGVQVICRPGRTLWDPDELVAANGDKPTMSISQVQKAAAKLGDPARPLAAPDSLPDPGDTGGLARLDHEVPDAEPDFNAAHRDAGADASYASIMGPKRDFAVPTLEELGISGATGLHRGGESRALQALERIVKDEDYVGTFEKPKTAPTAFDPPATTLLSPHLHFGSLSVRKFYWDVRDVIEKRKKAGKSTSSMPANLPGQLVFRDMYHAAEAALGASYWQAVGNPVCRFVDWHLPSELDKDGQRSGTYTVDSPVAERWFRRWRHGRTGFPFVDALMRQLKHEGWIHHLGRHMVACFLTRGGCYVHWERGAEVFEELLVDHDAAANIGNWMWLSCTAFFAQYYRCYSPVSFGRKWDPEGDFIRRYVPELKDFDKKYIYEPWKAPIVDQKKWGCRVQGDGGEKLETDLEALYGERDDGKLGAKAKDLKSYPKPMFDFNERRQVCINSLKNAYNIGLHGNDKAVLNGSWKKTFEFEVEKGAGQKADVSNGAGVQEMSGEDDKEDFSDDYDDQGSEDQENTAKNGKRSHGESGEQDRETKKAKK